MVILKHRRDGEVAAMNSSARRQRVFVLISLFLLMVIFPAKADAVVFNQQDINQLVEVYKTVQSLAQDVSSSLRSLPSYEVGKIQSYAVVELNLEAIRERWNSVFLLVAVSSQLETRADEARVLNLLHGEVLPKAQEYVAAKKNAIVSLGRAQSDNQLALYSGRAASIIENQSLPLLDRLYRLSAPTR
jgi:hypothetical protein